MRVFECGWEGSVLLKVAFLLDGWDGSVLLKVAFLLDGWDGWVDRVEKIE